MKFQIGDKVRIIDVRNSESQSFFAKCLNATGEVINVPDDMRYDYIILLDKSSIIDKIDIDVLYCREHELEFVFNISNIFDIDI